MKTATFVSRTTSPVGADQRLYRLTPPMRAKRWSDEAEEYVDVHYEHVVVSAVFSLFSGPETYVFGASADGEIVNLMEQDGSFEGGLDHAEALRRAGYEVRP